jgi:coenzyme PQQ precursor peptide PqqA
LQLNSHDEDGWWPALVRDPTGHCEEEIMEWTTPQFEEINLNCEINSYASAEM